MESEKKPYRRGLSVAEKLGVMVILCLAVWTVVICLLLK